MGTQFKEMRGHADIIANFLAIINLNKKITVI